MRFLLHILCLFALLHDFGIVNAKGKNELGIGIGSIYYSKQYQPKLWQYNLAFQKSHEVTTDDVNVLTLPAIYYTRFLHRRLQFRIHYQYARESRKTVSYWDQSTYRNTETKHVISLGYYYSFSNLKFIQIAAGIGFEGDATYFKYKSSTNTQDQYKNWTVEGLLMPSLRLSFTVPIYKRINLKYDVACKSDLSHLYFSPLNRLSLNVGF